MEWNCINGRWWFVRWCLLSRDVSREMSERIVSGHFHDNLSMNIFIWCAFSRVKIEKRNKSDDDTFKWCKFNWNLRKTKSIRLNSIKLVSMWFICLSNLNERRKWRKKKSNERSFSFSDIWSIQSFVIKSTRSTLDLFHSFKSLFVCC